GAGARSAPSCRQLHPRAKRRQVVIGFGAVE
ncbi:ATPase, partial [Rhizobium ruizarguesonis]